MLDLRRSPNGRVHVVAKKGRALCGADAREWPSSKVKLGRCARCEAVQAERDEQAKKRRKSVTKATKPHIEDDGLLYGVVEVDLGEIIDHDFEGFLDLLSKRLTGTGVLSDIRYSVVGHKLPDVVLIEVGGDPSQAMEHKPEIRAMWEQMEKRLAAREKAVRRYQEKKDKRTRKKAS